MGLQSYRNRVTHYGTANLRQRVKNDVRESLQEFLDVSQYGFDVEIDGKIETIGIMTSKMSDAFDGVYVLSKPNVLKMGTIFKWDDEYWVVLKRTVRVIKESFYGEAYRCNIELKWVDKDGNLKIQKGYGKGRGFSALLVENVISQSSIMMREAPIPLTVATTRNLEFKQDMRFIFNGLPYRVTAVDHVSIDGMTILGMYDDILQEGDDLVNSIANYDNKYKIEVDFESPVEVFLGDAFKVDYTMIENGLPIPDRDIIIDVDPLKARVNEEEGTITPFVPGNIEVTVRSKQNPTIEKSFILHANAEELILNNIYVVGLDKLEWNTSATYQLNNGMDCEFKVKFPDKVKGTYEVTDNSITISIKDKYSGTIELKALVPIAEDPDDSVGEEPGSGMSRANKRYCICSSGITISGILLGSGFVPDFDEDGNSIVYTKKIKIVTNGGV